MSIEEIPEVYLLESVEQMRAVADDLRQRIYEPLVTEAMTVTQLGDLLGLAPSKVHYHVRELERVGLVRLVETREKGGILEKYYRAVARTIRVSPTLLQRATPDDALAAVAELVQSLGDAFLRAAGRRAGAEEATGHGLLGSRAHLWITAEELSLLGNEIDDLMERYRNRRGLEDEYEYTFGALAYRTSDGLADDESSGASTDTSGELDHNLVYIGSVTMGRKELEPYASRRETFDLSVWGHLTFDPAVTPELVRQAIRRLRHRGRLTASPGVQAALEEKRGSRQRT